MHFNAYGLRELKLKGIRGVLPDVRIMEKLADKCISLKVLEVTEMDGVEGEVRDFIFTWAS